MRGFITRRSVSGLLIGCSLAIVSISCDNNDPLGTVATGTSSLATSTDTFTGTLTLNGGKTFPFTVTNPGQITASVTSITPDSSQVIGLALGTWNGSSCQIVLSNDDAIVSTTVIGQAATSGNFCARVYDSTGTLPQVETYTISVAHP